MSNLFTLSIPFFLLNFGDLIWLNLDLMRLIDFPNIEEFFFDIELLKLVPNSMIGNEFKYE